MISFLIRSICFNNTDKIGSACRMHGKDEKCIYDFSRKNYERRQLRRVSSILDDDIEIDPQEII